MPTILRHDTTYPIAAFPIAIGLDPPNLFQWAGRSSVPHPSQAGIQSWGEEQSLSVRRGWFSKFDA